MGQLNLTPRLEVEAIFNNYPNFVRDAMQALRTLIIETAEENDTISDLEETLKWGEPSYVTKHGSTIRIDWKPKSPAQYAIYFQCTSRLVETFKLVFNQKFQYEGKRAIVFQLNEKLPLEELKLCINAALTYHKVKHLITLGI